MTHLFGGGEGRGGEGRGGEGGGGMEEGADISCTKCSSMTFNNSYWLSV